MSRTGATRQRVIIQPLYLESPNFTWTSMPTSICHPKCENFKDSANFAFSTLVGVLILCGIYGKQYCWLPRPCGLKPLACIYSTLYAYMILNPLLYIWCRNDRAWYWQLQCVVRVSRELWGLCPPLSSKHIELKIVKKNLQFSTFFLFWSRNYFNFWGISFIGRGKIV